MTLSSRFYGLGVMAMGLVSLAWGDFDLGQPVSKSLPFYTSLAYVVDVFIVVAGAAIEWRRTAAWGAAALGAYFGLIVVLLMYGHLLFAHYAEFGTYSGAAEQLAIAAGGLLVYAGSAKIDATLRARLTRLGQRAFGVCALLFGGAHFFYLNLTVPLVPQWLPPNRKFWAYATGIAHIAAGAAILTGVQGRLAAILLTIMFAAFTPLVHLPMLLGEPTSRVNWSENALNLALIGAAWVVASSMTARALASLALAIALTFLAAGSAKAADAPVLVELFTAEGCSSCPPADQFLGQLDAAQPIPGARLIVLSEHVDYWDRQGWPDAYASKAFTERQAAYERSLKVREPFTPQFIVDGSIDMRLSRPGLINGQLRAAAASDKVPVSIESLRIEAGPAPTISGVVSVEAVKGRRPSELFVGVALDHVETQVLRGENRGRHLTHVAVLRELERVVAVPPDAAAHEPFSLALGQGLDSARLRIIALLQQPGPGAVLGAAEQTIAPIQR